MPLRISKFSCLLIGLILLQLGASSCGGGSCSGACGNIPGAGGAGGGGNTQAPVAFLYVGSNQILPFVLKTDNSFTAVPNANVPLSSGTAAQSIAVVAKSFLYVIDSAGNLTGYTINRATGALTAIALNLSAFASGSVFIADPLGRFLFVFSNNSINVLSINATLGTLTAVGQPTALPFSMSSNNGLAVDPLGKFLVFTNGNSGASFTISSTGTVTLVPGTIATSMVRLAFDLQSKFLYGVDGTSPNVNGFQISTTGVLTQLSGFPIQTSVANRNLAFNPKASLLYVGEDNNIVGYKQNTTSGALTLVQQAAFATTVNGNQMAIDQNGNLLFTNGVGLSVLSINQTTGVLTLNPNQISSSGFLNAVIAATD